MSWDGTIENAPVATLTYVLGHDASNLAGKAAFVLANLNSSSNPTVNSDVLAGFSVGSPWFNSSTGRYFIARSVGAGVAVWQELQLSDHPGYIATYWLAPFGYTNTATSGAMPVNAIRGYPGWVKERISINNLGMRVIANAAGNVQAAIYRNNPATGRPTGTAVVSTASMSTASAGTISAAAVAQLEPGLYWFCSNTDTAALTFTTQINSLSGLMGQIIGSPTQGNVLGGSSGSLVGISSTQTFGTWPDLTSATITELVASAGVAGLEFQVSSVP